MQARPRFNAKYMGDDTQDVYRESANSSRQELADGEKKGRNNSDDSTSSTSPITSRNSSRFRPSKIANSISNKLSSTLSLSEIPAASSQQENNIDANLSETSSLKDGTLSSSRSRDSSNKLNGDKIDSSPTSGAMDGKRIASFASINSASMSSTKSHTSLLSLMHDRSSNSSKKSSKRGSILSRLLPSRRESESNRSSSSTSSEQRTQSPLTAHFQQLPDTHSLTWDSQAPENSFKQNHHPHKPHLHSISQASSRQPQIELKKRLSVPSIRARRPSEQSIHAREPVWPSKSKTVEFDSHLTKTNSIPALNETEGLVSTPMTATNSVAQSFGISLMDDDGSTDLSSIANPNIHNEHMYRLDSTAMIPTSSPAEKSIWKAPESWKVKTDELEGKDLNMSTLSPVESNASSTFSMKEDGNSPTSILAGQSQIKLAPTHGQINSSATVPSSPLATEILTENSMDPSTDAPSAPSASESGSAVGFKSQEHIASSKSGNLNDRNMASVSGPAIRRGSKALNGSSRSSVRIFKGAKSSLLPCTLDTTCKNILDVLRRKRFLKQDDDYMLVLKCGGLTRTLSLQEKPLRIQRKTLFLYGYTERDNLDYIERTDLSFLFKFVVEEKGIEVISEEKKRIIDPQNVTLDNWNLQDIPNFLYAEPIVTLDVSQNPSFEFTEDFMHDARNLTSLKFTKSGSPAFPTAVVFAPRISYLNLGVNYIRNIPSEISKMTTLHILNMACNRISHLPDTFGMLINLQTLNLASNRLKQIPPQIFKLTQLRKLDLSYNLISNIPDEISQLTELETLQVAGNNIKGELNESFSKFENLIKVDFRFNNLTSVESLKKSPRLEVIRASGNNISVFRSRAQSLFEVELNMNPLTYVYFECDMVNLKLVDFSKGKLTSCAFTSRLVSAEKLSLDYNHLTLLPDHISKMTNLVHFSLFKNNITAIPDSIVKLQKLKFLDLHLNNVGRVNEKVWMLSSLEVLNLASNLLEVFPEPPENLLSTYNTSAQLEKIKEFGKGEDNAIADDDEEAEDIEEKGKADVSTDSDILEGSTNPKISKAQLLMKNRRLSETGMSVSVVDKDIPSLASSLKQLYLCDNKLKDSVFSTLSLMKNLECLNLSYNEIFEIPPGYLSKLKKLKNLFLSGNFLSSLPIEDFDELGDIETLNLNGNRFGTLPAELSMLKKLSALDVGNNQLKYNIGNVPYDWNWCYNKELKFLNFSGNKRLEIKPQHSVDEETGEKLDSFLSLTKLKTLGLMDVTITTDSVPDQSVGTRIRSTVSQLGKFGYGISDSLGSSDSLTTRDVVIEKFRGNSDEVLITIYDGKNSSQKGGDKISKIIQETFEIHLTEELKTLGESINNSEQVKTVEDCLRGAFLTMNSEMSILINKDESSTFSSAAAHRTKTTDKLTLEEDGLSGCSATIIYIRGDYVYVANVGDIMGILTKSDGEFNIITTKHEPYATKEYDRIRDSGGYVNTDGKLDGVADVSRAVGFFKLMPHINAKPSIHKFKLTRNEEMIAICTSEVWKRVSFELAADIIRQEKSNPIGAAEKLRDFSISYSGKDKKVTAVVLSLRQFTTKQKHYNAPKPEDSTLRKLDDEIEPPTGDLAMVFTDIKNSTLLWDNYPEAMRSAIKVHNAIMRRQLRIIGGYEVKTEGDAFIVSFPTPTAALLWCFIVQTQLLTTTEWPAEIISSDQGFEVKDNEGNLIYRGLSVRMGVHWGKPVCEMDVVTKRMDYFGPMVNRASRVSSVADGGQITMSTDFYHEMEKVKKIHKMIADGKLDVSRAYQYKAKGRDVENQVNQLVNIGMVIENIGAKKLKGLEAPENIWVIFPKPLSSRLVMLTNKDGEIKNKSNTMEVGGINVDTAWALRKIALRLEKVASFLGAYHPVGTKAQTGKLADDVQGEAEMSMSQKMADVQSFLLVFLDHTITRIENCVAVVATRQILGQEQTHGQSTLALLDVMQDMARELAELRKQLPSA